MNKENRQQKAINVFTSSKGVNAVCVTSDGSTFVGQNKAFADAHSQRLEDKSIMVFGTSEEFTKDNKNLFFEGSKWSFEMINVDETDDQSGIVANDEMTIKELKAIAKDLDGFKSSMNKTELIELING